MPKGELAMSQETTVQPKLADLLTRYLERQSDACAAGAAASPDEVTAYEAGPVQPIDPKLAWDESLAAIVVAGPSANTRGWKAPPCWSSLVSGHEPVVALAMCAASFPQLVRNFHMILQMTDLTLVKPHAGRPVEAPELMSWADDVADRKQFPQALVALGTLRLAKQFDAATAFARKLDAEVPTAWQTAWDNEKAALAWHAGRDGEALASWQKLEPTVPVLFNRGMAELFMGQAEAAREHLALAVAQMPETSAWHHLGRLYLALAR
jgi:tetratricopeptide (TPR) repeat protein